MKRSWIGIGLLTVLLVLGIWVAKVMENNHMPGGAQLRQAAELAQAGEWEAAEALTRRARRNWEGTWKLTASVADHQPMDQIDGLFAELRVYAATGDKVAYSGTCAHLAELLEAMGNAHNFTWWNLL